jgi:SagB-type dehydrogenase family enzyme
MPERDSIAQHYHQRTKYDPQTLQSSGKPLDWSQQPLPFKDYKLGLAFDLKPYLQADSLRSDPALSGWVRLSRLLFYSYGLTGIIPTGGEPHYFRAAPSAGGLYPAEIYLISRGTPMLPAGLYNYQARTHTLLNFWESDEVWSGLQTACLANPLLAETAIALVVTGVMTRSAWRYADRAYRRVCLDSGHLLGNLSLAGSLTQFRPHLIAGFADRALTDLLYLNEAEEGAIAVLPLVDLQAQKPLPLTRVALPGPLQTDYSRHIAEGELWRHLHQATQIPSDPPSDPLSALQGDLRGDLRGDPQGSLKLDWRCASALEERPDPYNLPFCLKVPMQTAAIDWGEDLADLETTLLKRRSTRGYTGADLTLAELQALLSFTYQSDQYDSQQLDGHPDYCDLNRVETFIAVSGVSGLEAGCYHYAPQFQELRQVRFKNFRRELHFLCLGQDLGRDAAAVVFHTANLETAIGTYGDRAYRYLHLDAGHLGQRLNLAAIRLGLGVSGIAGFFDDQVNEVLGIPADEAVLYITTLGRGRRQ